MKAAVLTKPAPIVDHPLHIEDVPQHSPRQGRCYSKCVPVASAALIFILLKASCRVSARR